MRAARRQITVILALVAMIAVNGLASTTVLNGQTTAAVSDRIPAYFVPAGYVFSIWGVIYLFLIGYAVYQALPAQRANARVQSVGYLFALSCVANMVWLILWQYEVFLATVVVMLALLGLLIAIYLRLGIGRARVGRGAFWLVQVPFSIYLGWITVATIANVTALLYVLHWNGWGIAPQVWAVLMLVAATVIAAIMTLKRGDVAYLLVLLWAFAGIVVKQAATPTVATAAWSAAAVVFVLIVAALLKRQGVRRQ
jgi:translocator protein